MKPTSPGTEVSEDALTSESDTIRHTKLRWRVVFALVVVVPLAYASLVNAQTLDNPPAWDSSTTVSPAALTIVEYGFNVWEVAQLPSSLEGGPSIHSTSVYTIGLAALIALVGPVSAFYLAHVGSIMLIGFLSAATFLLARERSSLYVSALAAVTISIMPVVVQQAADVYIDLPLAVIATLACWGASRRRFWLTTVLVILAVAVKTAAVFLIPLIFFARPTATPARRHLGRATLAGLLALVPFFVAFSTTDRFDQGGQLADNLGLLGSSAAMLLLTTDVWIMVVVFLIVTYARARTRELDRPTMSAVLTMLGFIGVYGGTAVLSGTIAILPRYYIVLLPMMLVAVLPGEHSKGRRPVAIVAGVGFVLVLAIFSLLNVRGDYYPYPDDEFYVLAERSTRAQELLELQIVGTRELVATGLPLVVDGPTHFRLRYPDMGYVDQTPDHVMSTFQRLEQLPDEFATLIERRFGTSLLAIEERALDEGYVLTYEDLTYRGFDSQLIVARR